MKCILMDYVQESGWNQLSKAEQQHWLGAYQGYLDAMAAAGVLRSGAGLELSATAATVRVIDGRSQVLDGPYADTKEQIGGFHILEVPDFETALAWAARCPTSLHGVVEVRAVRDKSIADWLAEANAALAEKE